MRAFIFLVRAIIFPIPILSIKHLLMVAHSITTERKKHATINMCFIIRIGGKLVRLAVNGDEKERRIWGHRQQQTRTASRTFHRFRLIDTNGPTDR